MKFGEFHLFPLNVGPQGAECFVFPSEINGFLSLESSTFHIFLKSANFCGNPVIFAIFQLFDAETQKSHLKSSFSARAQNALFSLAKSMVFSMDFTILVIFAKFHHFGEIRGFYSKSANFTKTEKLSKDHQWWKPLRKLLVSLGKTKHSAPWRKIMI